jgi:hypothetical protein
VIKIAIKVKGNIPEVNFNWELLLSNEPDDHEIPHPCHPIPARTGIRDDKVIWEQGKRGRAAKMICGKDRIE